MRTGGIFGQRGDTFAHQVGDPRVRPETSVPSRTSTPGAAVGNVVQHLVHFHGGMPARCPAGRGRITTRIDAGVCEYRDRFRRVRRQKFQAGHDHLLGIAAQRFGQPFAGLPQPDGRIRTPQAPRGEPGRHPRPRRRSIHPGWPRAGCHGRAAPRPSRHWLRCVGHRQA